MAENFIKITYKRKEIYKTILLLFQHPHGGELIMSSIKGTALMCIKISSWGRGWGEVKNREMEMHIIKCN